MPIHLGDFFLPLIHYYNRLINNKKEKIIISLEERKANMERYDIEELVLGFADIVRENRYLRQENARLRKIEKEYHQSIIDRCRECPANSKREHQKVNRQA